MNIETEIKIYEFLFGINARPEHLNNIPKEHKRELFSKSDLIETLQEIDQKAFLFDKMNEALQNEGYDINKGVSG